MIIRWKIIKIGKNYWYYFEDSVPKILVSKFLQKLIDTGTKSIIRNSID